MTNEKIIIYLLVPKSSQLPIVPPNIRFFLQGLMLNLLYVRSIRLSYQLFFDYP